LNPQFDKAFLLMGRAYNRLSKPVEAMQAFEKARALNPACDQCRLDLAILLAASGDKARSTALLRELVVTNPRNADARYELGKLLGQQNKVDEAIGEFEQAVAVDDEHDGARYQLAALYRKRGQNEKAAQVLSTLRKRKEQQRKESEAKLLQNEAKSPER
jgi:tetratricopeptide (TPR) repeat protein